MALADLPLGVGEKPGQGALPADRVDCFLEGVLAHDAKYTTEVVFVNNYRCLTVTTFAVIVRT